MTCVVFPCVSFFLLVGSCISVFAFSSSKVCTFLECRLVFLDFLFSFAKSPLHNRHIVTCLPLTPLWTQAIASICPRLRRHTLTLLLPRWKLAPLLDSPREHILGGPLNVIYSLRWIPLGSVWHRCLLLYCTSALRHHESDWADHAGLGADK